MSLQKPQLLFLFMYLLNGVNSIEYVPVFMWGATTGSSHNTRGMSKVDAAAFRNILTEQLDSEPFTVVFIEETLSVEDFSTKDNAGRSSYPGLREKMTGDSLIYYPYVASSLHTLNRIVDPDKIDRVQLTADGLSADITPGTGQFLYISLKDAREGEDRMHMLSRHDKFMTEMFDKLLKKHDSVLAIYTARQPSWAVTPEKHHYDYESSHHRVARSLLSINWTSPATPENGLYNGTDNANGILLFASNIKVLDSKDSSYVQELKAGQATMSNQSDAYELSLKFTDTTLVFLYELTGDGYYDVGLTLKQGGNEIVMDNKFQSPRGFSLHCSNFNYTNTNETRVVYLENYQTQLFLGSTDNVKFSLAVDCVGYTTVPILSGLFVTLLLLIITSIGIMMMMDIRTMDRFDDPKGKTITITTTEQ